MDNQTILPVVTQPPAPQLAKQPPTSLRSRLRPLLLTLLGVVIIAGIGYGIYLWQHSKVNTLSDKVTILQSQLSSAKNVDSSTSTKQTSTSSSSTTQNALSSPMPQSQYSNPAFTATLDYLSCLSNSGGSSKIVSSTECQRGNQTYTAPTTFTYAMITNYSWLPESADSTFVNKSEQLFQECSSSQGSGIGGANKVDYSNANFVIFTYSMCGDSKTGLYKDENGTWTSVGSSGVGGTCTPYSGGNIPANIIKYYYICTAGSN